MSAPLTDEELADMRSDCTDAIGVSAQSRQAKQWLRLLDEHAELKRSQCTEEERKVLDAVAALDLGECKLDEDGLTGNEVEAIVEAELARREAERANGDKSWE